MSTEVLIAIIGVIATIISAWCGWFFTRKKYNAEVDASKIDNAGKIIEYYQHFVDECGKTSKVQEDALQEQREMLKYYQEINTELQKSNNELQKEIFDVKTQLTAVMSQICTDLTCTLRKVYNNKRDTINID